MKETPMQIIMNQDEIEEAITAYVHNQVNVKEGQKISIDLKSGRGDNSFTATLEIRSMLGSVSQPKTTFREMTSSPKPVEPEPENAPEPKVAKAAPKGAETRAAKDDPEEDTTGATPDEAPDDKPAAEPAAAASADDAPEEAPSAKRPTSIFNFAQPAKQA